jgi:hypothetical protein
MWLKTNFLNRLSDNCLGLSMSSDKIKETKERILDWLKEETFSPEEKADPQAYYNILCRIGALGCNIVQDVHHMDSFFVATNLILGNEQIVLLKSMGEGKRKGFFVDLRMNLLKNSELGQFAIKPNPPEEIQIISVASKRVYYDELTKGKLISAIEAVIKAITMTIWMLEQYAGITAPKTGHKTQDYST